MKKALFSLLFLLLFASVTIASFLGAGTVYLYRQDILKMDENAVQITLESKIDESAILLHDLEQDMGMELKKYLLEPETEETRDRIHFELARKIIGIALEKSWEDAKAFANKYHVEYYVVHSLGRIVGGNLKVVEQEDTSVQTVSYYNKGTLKVETYRVYVRYDKQAFQSTLSEDYRILSFWIKNRYFVVTGFVTSALLSFVLLCFACFLFKRKNVLEKTNLDGPPLDLVLVMGGAGAWFLICNLVALSKMNWTNLMALLLNWCAVTLLLLTIFFFVIWRLQRKGWHRQNLWYWTLQAIKKTMAVWVEIFKNLSTTKKFLFMELGICLLEALLILLILPWQSATWILLGSLGGFKVFLLPWILRYGLALEKVKRTTQELAVGNLDSQVDVKELPKPMQAIGENVNAIAGSISVAVEERLKSERLKTELITNVSHDIKTPLTSIINFSDMIQKEKTENEKITEYAEHLHRQSSRLKKLIEDLMEASKASTGNLEVHLEPCDVKVLLGQCLGEFEPRLQEKNLELIVRQDEQQLHVMADNRMLWRVFENLMNNICKYAQADTRVYLSAKPVDGQAEITFKNVSKYALDVEPQELTERFVRGDLSRHTEGFGLGLSIVSSLMELQGGKLSLATDGDLFKAILTFPLISATSKGETLQD